MVKERIDYSDPIVGRAVNLIFRKLERKQRPFLLEAFDHYNNLPKRTSKEGTIARNFVTKTAEELLQNPQVISLADKTWRRHEEGRNGLQESGESFSERVRKERLTLIKDKWESVEPEQLAQLVRIYASNDPSKDTAKALLTNYFKGPESRNQSVHAYYNLVSGVFDLAEDKEPFIEGVKIALHATDVLPKNPSLVEQTAMLSLPTKKEEEAEKGRVFQKLLASRAVIAQVRFIDSWDIWGYYEDRGNFIKFDSVLIDEGEKRKLSVIKQTSSQKASALYETMTAMMSFFASASIESLSEERKQELMRVWPYGLVFRDPLYQKFERVLSQRAASKISPDTLKA